MVEKLQWHFGFSGQDKREREPQPHGKAVAYSFAILAAFFVGTVLEARLRFTGYGEAFGAIPVLLAAVFVLRLPPPAAIRVHWVLRSLLLLLPFLILLFADYALPVLDASDAALWVAVIVQALGIALSEELTFRFSLHRLWSHYGGWFYVLASTTIFAVGHYPLGLQVSIISGVIGAAFAASRVAGMPLIVLIVLHAFFDLPMLFRALGAN